MDADITVRHASITIDGVLRSPRGSKVMRGAAVLLSLSFAIAACGGGDEKSSADSCKVPGDTRRCSNAAVTRVGEQTCGDDGKWSKCELFETHPCASPPACSPCPGETTARLAMCIDGQPRCPTCPGDKDGGGMVEGGVADGGGSDAGNDEGGGDAGDGGAAGHDAGVDAAPPDASRDDDAG